MVCSKAMPTRKGLTCSSECAYKNRFGTRQKEYTEENKPRLRFHHKPRLELIQKRGSKCELCSYAVEQVLNVHHIVERKDGGTNEESNLIVLCPNCHAEVHNGLKKLGS